MRYTKIAEYSIFFVSYVILAVLFWFFRYDAEVLKRISLFGTVFYVLWGVIHQAVNQRLSFLAVSEYILIGLFAYLILLLALSY